MFRAISTLAIAALAACGGEKAPADEPAGRKSPPPAAVAKAEPAPAAAAADAEASEDAAAVLRRYYRLIGERDYERAAKLRSRRGAADAARLADTFKAYRTYKVQVGAPGRPARSGDWLFVTVPVMITGSFVGGETFGSAGSVTMRRAASDEAPAGERGWRVYTG